MSNAPTHDDGRAATLPYILLAALIWLFAVLVFIPLARSVSSETELIVLLLFLAFFTLALYKAYPAAGYVVEVVSRVAARKMGVAKGMSKDDASVFFRYLAYIFSLLIVYLLYLPFLLRLHSALAGIALILLLIVIFFLAFRLSRIIWPYFISWGKSD